MSLFLYIVTMSAFAHTPDGYCLPNERPCCDAPFVKDGSCHFSYCYDRWCDSQFDDCCCESDKYPPHRCYITHNE